MPDQLGSSRKQHPIPMRLKNPNVPKDQGGSFGYRGKGFTKAREMALRRGRYRSTNTGLDDKHVKLEVDHIIPYRVGGLTSHTNSRQNLRLTDFDNNRYSDNAQTFAEKKRKRTLEKF